MPNWTPGPWRWINHCGTWYLRAASEIEDSECPKFNGFDPIVDDGSAGGEHPMTIDPRISPAAPLLEGAPELYRALEATNNILGNQPHRDAFGIIEKRLEMNAKLLAACRGEQPPQEKTPNAEL